MTPELKGFILLSIIKLLLVFTVVMVGVMMVIWAERRISGFIQDRLGPNRVGPAGLLQSVADGLKNILKEETWPAKADRRLFLLAPVLSFTPALLLQAVIPFAAPLPVDFDFRLPLIGEVAWHGPVPMVVADLPIGFLYILALTSLGVYGIVLAGWSSGSKYALLGGLRSSAQMISYEIAMGMTLVSVMLVTGNVTLSRVIAAEQQSLWFVFPLLIGFVMFVVASLAETNRLPFDLPETESELITGYHTEYSSMKFSMFFIAEYSNLMTASAMMATIFFGGWDIPFTTWDQRDPSVLKSLVTMLAFAAKTLVFIFVFIWVRWTLPRFRFDQLMALGWKVLLPLALF
ncbi:MAG: NADH-quinone oxidoreductase subunit NuoH, partial [Gemmatimonadetes bacterium]|nr:NADH-quinone oxidoreductase subunit NuoH [Gemmatimonadota bacterium]